VTAGVFGGVQCFVYGYGRLADAPTSAAFPGLRVLKPGCRIRLAQTAHHGEDSNGCIAAQEGSAAGTRAGQLASLERAWAASPPSATPVGQHVCAGRPEEGDGQLAAHGLTTGLSPTNQL
jgi:hypothetical protein